jgi:dienelactone hydrolase
LLLTGSNSLIRELTDNIRCIDFLEQHPAVNKDKIAVAGNSGGGTQTTYLAAYDRRIKVAVPSCYIATTEKKFHTIGSQDGCQQLWGEGKAGIEEQDFLFMSAPVPILVLSAKQDFFNIDGAVSAYNELKGLYTVLGSADKVDMSINDFPHGWHKPMREAAVQWCKRWLLNDPSPVIEPGDMGKLDNVSASPTGQVLTSFPKEKSVTDISIERLGKARLTRSVFQKSNTPAQITTVVKSLCGFEEPAKVIRSENKGVIQRDGYVVEMLLIERDTQSNFSMPALLIIPDNAKAKSPGVIIISENGKDSVLTPASQIMKELAKGNIVLAVDLSNTGELKHSGRIHYENNEFWIGKLALYEGKSLMTYRAEEIIMAKRFLQDHPKVNKNNISIHSTGLTGPSALHAAFFDQGFSKMTVTGSIDTWEDVASAGLSKNQLANIIPDVLNYYDLPDLIRWTPGTKIEIDSTVDALGKLKKN